MTPPFAVQITQPHTIASHELIAWQAVIDDIIRLDEIAANLIARVVDHRNAFASRYFLKIGWIVLELKWKIYSQISS